jgi:photosystem II stability/assembly factor-like uncharacterized protein
MSKHLYRRLLLCLCSLALVSLTALEGPRGWAADETEAPFKVTPAKAPGIKANLHSIRPIDADAKCVLVGDKGTVARSEDGGQTWKVLKTGQSADLFDVRFNPKSSQLGLAVGDGGEYSAPAEKVPEGVYLILKDKYIMGGGNVWSTILRTTDGGRSWKRIEGPTNLTINGVSWLDDKRAIATYSDLKAKKPNSGGFCTSEDAGLTWKVFYDIGAPLKAITIGPDRTGWVVGFPTVADQKILLPGKPPKGFKDLTEADKKELTADVIRSLSLPAGINATSFDLKAKGTAPLNRTKVVADGLVVEGIESLNFAAMIGEKAWVVGDKGFVAVAERKDKKWEEFTKVEVGEKEAESNFHGIAWRDSNTGMIAGDAGVCLYTTDAGKTWKRLETGTEKNLTAVNFIGKKHAVLVGEEGTVLYVGKNGEEKK